MQKLYDEVGSLDKRCVDTFAMSEDLLMEHAAQGMATFIRNKFDSNTRVLIVCGGGNNGADGIALARLLLSDFQVELFCVSEASSALAKVQTQRLHALGLKKSIYINECDVLVDAIYGSGFRGSFTYEVNAVLETLNRLDAYKIACDVPSGISQEGAITPNTFQADTTLCMGAFKKSLFSDKAKDYVGEIEVIDLGLPRDKYELDSSWHLLDLEDLELPFRTTKNTHKGSYGHLALAVGEKVGASSLSAIAALRFGSGLVTLVTKQQPNLPHSLMFASKLPQNTTALAVGMGLGEAFTQDELHTFLNNTLPAIVDADIFHMDILKALLKRQNLVITPHPKEFVSLLKATKLADITIEELQENRFKYVELFSKHFKDVTLLLKGANVIIVKGDQFFINPHGSAALAKGGSGDVLSGLIGSLLAQGYTPLNAAIHGSLAHTKLVQNFKGADFSLIPEDLIDGICNL